jgi:threonine/homoserine/homoserine lactone efflux protein
VAVAGLLLSATPGPSMLYVLSRSIGQSKGAGLASTAGLAIGGILLAVASALGLIAVIRYSPKLYTFIQLAGAAYLFYLGVIMIRSAGKDDMTVREVKNHSYSKILRQGILVEILNPKTALFFLAFIPQFVNYESSDITIQLLILGLLVPLTAIPSDIIVSIGGGSLAICLSKKPKVGYILAWLSGLILIGLALRLLFL